MVPSRSRKTARRFGLVGESGTGRRLQPFQRGGVDVGNRDARHAAMVDGTFAQKTRAARNFPLHESASRRDGRGAMRVGRTENTDDGHADSGSYVHGAGIIYDKQLAT